MPAILAKKICGRPKMTINCESRANASDDDGFSGHLGNWVIGSLGTWFFFPRPVRVVFRTIHDMIAQIAWGPLALSSTQWVLLDGAIMLVLICVFAGVMAAVRRRLHSRRPTDFEIDTVENLHRQGLISDEEFSRLRRKALRIGQGPSAPPAEGDDPGGEISPPDGKK
jgi:hypothetical protein